MIDSFEDRDDYAYVDNWPWPSGRFEHSAVMRGEEMIVYGGHGPKFLDYCNDIWAWSLAAPAHNKGSAIAFDNNATAPLWQQAAFLSRDEFASAP